jgi:CheY-like chemotaxis protein
VAVSNVPAGGRAVGAEASAQGPGGSEPARAFSEERAFDALIDFLAREAVRVMGADRSSIFLLDADRRELWSRVALGLDRQEIRFPADRGIAGYVASSGRVLNVPDPYADERFNPAVDRQTGYRTRSILCAPLRARSGQVIGVLQVLNKLSGEPFTVEDERALEAIAARCGLAIENALLYEELLYAEEHGAQPRTAHPRLLCIEGEQLVADRVTALLGGEFVVLIARDGAEALHLTMTERPEVIIIGVNGDGEAAFGLCAALRRVPSARETPVIVLSASKRPEDVVRAFEAGANDYLPKSFAPAQLRAKAHTWLLRSARPSSAPADAGAEAARAGPSEADR